VVIRLIATDLDGTLLRSDSTLSDRTRAVLRQARAAGLRIVAATARPARVIDDLFGSDDLIDLAICGNGAVRYHVPTRDLTIDHPLPQELARRVIAEITRILPGSGYAVETGRRVLFEPAYTYRPSLDHDRFLVDTVDELLAEGLVKLMVQTPGEDPDGAWAKLRPSLGDAIECTWSAEHAPLEIAAFGVSKASALTALCADWSVAAEEVIAFGDAPNDLPMLSWAGTAYAVANAHAPVLASTPLHTASNDDDGVAMVLEKLLAENALS
jgi:Cof subfamily protein (haloacid dehalogenase superfamily)